MTWSPIDFRGKRVLLLETSREVAATLASYGAVAQHVSQSWRASQATHHLHKDFAGGASVYMPVAGYLQAASCGSYDSVLVGEEFSGYLNFDYFSANCSFAWNYWIKAQYCWAHLIRDIRFLHEKHPDKATRAWAEQLLDRSRRLFRAWHGHTRNVGRPRHE